MSNKEKDDKKARVLQQARSEALNSIRKILHPKHDFTYDKFPYVVTDADYALGWRRDSHREQKFDAIKSIIEALDKKEQAIKEKYKSE